MKATLTKNIPSYFLQLLKKQLTWIFVLIFYLARSPDCSGLLLQSRLLCCIMLLHKFGKSP